MSGPVGNSYPGLGEYALKLIRTRARELSRGRRFTAADYDDLEQELVIDLLKRYPKFNPALAKEVTFVQRIVDHRVASLIAAQSAMARAAHARNISLNQEVQDASGDHFERWETLDEARYVRGSSVRKEADRRDLELDLANAIAALPARLRRLCHRLGRTTLTEIAEAKGISRSSLYGPIRELRAHFERAGIAAYVSGAHEDDDVAVPCAAERPELAEARP